MSEAPAHTPLKPEDFVFSVEEVGRGTLIFGGAVKIATGRPQGTVMPRHGRRYRLVDLGAGLGFEAPEFLQLLRYHQGRLKTYITWSAILFALAVAPLYILFMVRLFRSIEYLSDFQRLPAFVGIQAVLLWLGLGETLAHVLAVVVWILVIVALFPLTVLFAMLVLQGTVIRVYDFFVSKRYAPTACADIAINLLLYLSRDDVLTDQRLRKYALSHMRHLARKTLLLPLCYRSPDPETQRKVVGHFKALAAYIRERERWAIAPAETTLRDLRRDFRDLAAIYLRGDYGSFKWQAAGAEPAPPAGRWGGLLPGLVRFVGMVLPLGLMGTYLWNPALFPNVPGDNRSIVSFIFIAWLLLSLDVGLKLGIVGQLTSIAKGIKELK